MGEIPVELAQALQRSYGHLPAGKVRWRCSEGQMFLLLLENARITYGTMAVATCLGRTPQGLHYMLAQRLDGISWQDELPMANDIRPLQQSYAAVMARRAGGRQVRRATKEYRDMYQDLKHLLQAEWRLEVVAAISKIPLRELRRFQAPLTQSEEVAVALEELESLWETLKDAPTRRAIDPRGKTFLQQLHFTHNLGVSRAKIAHRLRVRPERVTILLRQGQTSLRKTVR